MSVPSLHESEVEELDLPGRGKHPWAIAVDSRANKTYVVNEDSATVSILDGDTGAAKHVGVGDVPFAVAVNPTTNTAYVLSYAANSMAVIDGAPAALPIPTSGCSSSWRMAATATITRWAPS